MSHPARLSLRAPPHLPFIQGYPGIAPSASRPQAAIHGTVEVRIGPHAIKAKWVRVEIRQHESIPPGYPGYANQVDHWNHAGEICTLWSAPSGKEFDDLEQADFKFYLPLPEDIPPSLELPKASGVRYELVAALCYRQKGGLFKKESAQIMKISEELRITKHELHSAWPIYNTPDTRIVSSQDRQVNLTVQRPGSAFGPSDRILLTATLKSARQNPFKLKGFECHLHEVITVTPAMGKQTSKKGKAAPPVTKTKIVASTRTAVDELVNLGGEKSARIEMPIPADKLLVTVKHGKILEVGYELEVRAICEGVPSVSGAIKYTVGPFSRGHAQQAVKEIGHYDALSPPILTPTNGQPRATSTSPPPAQRVIPQPASTNSEIPPLPPISGAPNPSSPQSKPQQNQYTVRGYVPRPSSAGSATTTTTMTTQTHDFQPNGAARPYSTMPQRQTVNFPVPNPGVQRYETLSNSSPASPVDSDRERLAASELGHGDDQSNRYSVRTNATFGRWDQGLKGAMGAGAASGGSSGMNSTPLTAMTPNRSTSSTPVPSTSTMPQSQTPAPSGQWHSAEQEKLRLYAQARSRAAATQQASGMSLDTLGLEEDAGPPPEYAPPIPAQPKEEYQAPSRPVSMYINNSPGTTGPSSPNASMHQSKGFMSAEEEKETQRTRFEEASRRVLSVSGGGAGASAGPSGNGDSASPARRSTQAFGGQADHTAEGSSGQLTPTQNTSREQEEPVPYDAIFPSGPSSPTTSPPSPQARSPLPSAIPSTQRAASSSKQGLTNGLSEKEQMRRYYAAQDRVAQSQPQAQNNGMAPDSPAQPSGSGSGSAWVDSPVTMTPSTPTGSYAVPPPAIPNAGSGLSEKEQMRRYYEAQDRVAQANNNQGFSLALSQNGQASMSSPTTPGLQDQTPGPRGSSTPTNRGAVPVVSLPPGLSEKEQMRRYYEAQDRVAQGGAGPSAGSSTLINGNGSGGGTGYRNQHQTSPTPKAAPPASGLSEKEQMRRYYEAQDRVAQGGSGQRPSSPRSLDRNGNGSGHGSQASPTPKAAPPASALSEKEQMRRYYEAQDRVAQAGGSGSAPGSGSTPQPYTAQSSPLASGAVTPSSPSAVNEKDQMKRYYEAQDRVARSGTGTGFKPSPSASPPAPNYNSNPKQVAAGPPPPLPKKPPMDYINLLSPVEERDKGFSFFGAGASSEAGDGEGSGSGGGAKAGESGSGSGIFGRKGGVGLGIRDEDGGG